MTSYDEALAITLEILKRYVVDDQRVIQPTDHIQNDLGFDSLGIMELVADLEDRFEVTIPNDVLATLGTAEDVARALIRLPPSR